VISQAALFAILRQPVHDARWWAIRWQYRRMLVGGDFLDELITAASHADDENLVRIALGWPELAEAIRCWRNVPGWSNMVEEWAESLVSSGASQP
jgi:hypothetical protein